MVGLVGVLFSLRVFLVLEIVSVFSVGWFRFYGRRVLVCILTYGLYLLCTYVMLFT